MRYAVILAEGSGTRLWPWSRAQRPKEIMRLLGRRLLLNSAFVRLEGVMAPGHRTICAGAQYQKAICAEPAALCSEALRQQVPNGGAMSAPAIQNKKAAEGKHDQV